MKKYLFIVIVGLILFSCKGELNKEYIGNNKYETKEQLNDSIVLIKRYNSFDKMEAANFKNTKSNICKIFFYDESGRLKESGIGFPNKNNSGFSYVDCRYFNTNGELLYRKILNSENELLVHFYYDSVRKLKRRVFYNEGKNSVRSEIAYDLNGNINNDESSFLMAVKKGNKLILKPNWIRGKHKYAKITMYTYDGYNRKFVKELNFNDSLELYIKISDLNKEKINSIVVSAVRGEIEGLPSLVPISILIDDVNNLPKNNLYPIILKDGKFQSGKYLLNVNVSEK